MNKRGRLATGLLIVLVVVVVLSTIVFSLIKLEVIEVEEVEGAQVLNADFIPYVREGHLAVKDFKFCEAVEDDYTCVGKSRQFNKPGEVFFRFVIESTVVNDEVMLVENYRLRDAQGNILLEANEEDNFYLDMKSNKEIQRIYFKDHLIIGEEDKKGKYILELIIENPLLNKKVVLAKGFEVI